MAGGQRCERDGLGGWGWLWPTLGPTMGHPVRRAALLGSLLQRGVEWRGVAEVLGRVLRVLLPRRALVL